VWRWCVEVVCGGGGVWRWCVLGGCKLLVPNDTDRNMFLGVSIPGIRVIDTDHEEYAAPNNVCFLVLTYCYFYLCS